MDSALSEGEQFNLSKVQLKVNVMYVLVAMAIGCLAGRQADRELHSPNRVQLSQASSCPLDNAANNRGQHHHRCSLLATFHYVLFATDKPFWLPVERDKMNLIWASV